AARSRSLFLWDDGRPMRFYVRPGLSKLRLAPLVLAGGGRLCRVQEPGAVLLAEPGEAAPCGAVSTEYVTESRVSSRPVTGSSIARRPQRFRERLGADAPRCHRRQRRFSLTTRMPLHRDIPPVAKRELLVSCQLQSDISDVSEEFSTQDGAENSPGESASDLKTGLEDSAFPDTQLQREERPTSTCSSSVVGEVVKTMQRFMEKFSVDLFTVTQAFLKNSGEVEATSDFLQMGQRLDGYPIWSREDDLELQKDDEHVRKKLIAKFGAENVAKRIAFRKS
ncbi:TE2IP protein, partial [Piprites chloris]|nr:TE2IP protein [Piprites chloris]